MFLYMAWERNKLTYEVHTIGNTNFSDIYHSKKVTQQNFGPVNQDLLYEEWKTKSVLEIER